MEATSLREHLEEELGISGFAGAQGGLGPRAEDSAGGCRRESTGHVTMMSWRGIGSGGEEGGRILDDEAIKTREARE